MASEIARTPRAALRRLILQSLCPGVSNTTQERSSTAMTSPSRTTRLTAMRFSARASGAGTSANAPQLAQNVRHTRCSIWRKKATAFSAFNVAAVACMRAHTAAGKTPRNTGIAITWSGWACVITT